MLRKYLSTLLFFAITAKSTIAFPGTIPLKVSMGVGAAIKNNLRKNNLYYADNPSVTFTPIPLLQISWGPLFIGQAGLTAAILGNKEKSIYLNINRVGDHYEASGMTPRKPSWFSGVGIKFNKFNFLYSRDIDGRSHGSKMAFSYSEQYTINQLFFTRSSLGIECYDSQYAMYYFGVRKEEVAFDRGEYIPNSFCVPNLSFFPGYKYSSQLSMLIGLAVRPLSAEIYHSPTIEKNWIDATVISGLLWQF